MAFKENPALFFGDFGVTVTLNAAPVQGIFLAPYAEAMGYVAGSRPSLLLPSLVGTDRGDIVAIANTSYEIVEIHSDETAIKTVVLEEV